MSAEEKSLPVLHREKADSSSASQRKRVGFVSLGCPKNLVDSEVMMGLLTQAGAELTPRAEDADVIVINTRSFIGSAKQESVDTILEMAAHKSSGRAQRLVVAGCLVERYRDEIRKNIPQVDAVVGTGEPEQRLAGNGVREITLIGQDTTCYGEDLGLKDGLALLLEKLAEIEELRWVRFLYVYPNKITGRLLEAIASPDKICSYIDVPLQHASP